MISNLWIILLIMISSIFGLIFFLYKIKFSEMAGNLIDPKYQGNKVILSIIFGVVCVDIILLCVLMCIVVNRLL